ncbi:hypothetical protein [Methyloprofundus sp.]|uniref:hypothetical protein n=1 Tax=Methyloprofundus sp. TaxID=2020875 RepID=UPI003D1152E2
MNYAIVGTFMLSVATLGGWLIVRYRDASKLKQVKWALFVLYFWILNFLQLIILALVHFLQR